MIKLLPLLNEIRIVTHPIQITQYIGVSLFKIVKIGDYDYTRLLPFEKFDGTFWGSRFEVRVDNNSHKNQEILFNLLKTNRVPFGEGVRGYKRYIYIPKRCIEII